MIFWGKLSTCKCSTFNFQKLSPWFKHSMCMVVMDAFKNIITNTQNCNGCATETHMFSCPHKLVLLNNNPNECMHGQSHACAPAPDSASIHITTGGLNVQMKSTTPVQHPHHHWLNQPAECATILTTSFNTGKVTAFPSIWPTRRSVTAISAIGKSDVVQPWQASNSSRSNLCDVKLFHGPRGCDRSKHLTTSSPHVEKNVELSTSTNTGVFRPSIPF